MLPCSVAGATWRFRPGLFEIRPTAAMKATQFGGYKIFGIFGVAVLANQAVCVRIIHVLWRPTTPLDWTRRRRWVA
jgi:hypothetical protein